jgi:zinc protease
MTIRRAGVAVLLALAGMLGSVAAGSAIPAKRVGVWAQSYSDRHPDPAIRYGTLPNGMRYAILHNATPPGQISLRLVIQSGSLAEAKGEEGIAHFLEHMAFRGSTHVADGELMRGLQRKGLAPGADSNAATSHEATVYQFDFPSGGKDAVDSGLGYLREIASELTIDPKAVDSERGVVLSEERVRDGPSMHATKALLGYTLEGQLAPARLPIGTIASVRKASAAELRAFYEAHYRPDNATILVVGDADPAQIEAAITARFADWRPRASAPAAPDLGKPRRRGEEVRLFSEPGAPTFLQLSWIRRYDDRADTAARVSDDLSQTIAQLILNQRFSDIARKPDAPFISAGIFRNNAFKSANITTLSIGANADRQPVALRAVVDELNRARVYGVTQAEFDRALAEFGAMLANSVAGANTRQTTALANRMMGDVIESEVTRSPTQDRDDFLGWKRTARVAAINQAIARMFEGSGALMFASAPEPLTGGEAALRAAYDAGMIAKVVRGAAAGTTGWPYTDFGPAGRVTARREIADLGVTLITFANGVTLAVKPTAFAKDEVLVDASFGGGRLALPRDRSHAYWLLSGPTFIDGGTAKADSGEIERMTAGHVVGARLQPGDDSFELAGRTRPEDLALQLQLMAAYVSDPGFRPEAVTRVVNLMATYLPQIDSTPGGVLNRDRQQLLHDGDVRWRGLTSPAQLAQTKPQDLPPLLKPALGGPLGVTIVGDVAVDQAIKLVASTFGALPPRPAWGVPPAPGVTFPPPTPKPLTLPHNGRRDQARAFVAWPTPDFWTNPRDARTMQVVSALIQQRLFDTVREKEGSTYSPETSSTASTTLPGYGYFSTGVEMPPEKLAGFFASVDAILADLRAHPIGADELERAKRPLLEARGRDLQQNSFWIGALPLGLRDPREYDAIRTRVSGTSAVTAADVQRVAQAYLRPDKAYRITVVPADKAE